MMISKLNRSLLIAILAATMPLLAATPVRAAELLAEDFEGGFPPNGWQRTGSGVQWQSTASSDESNHTGGTGEAALADAYDNPGAYSAVLISPAVALPTGQGALSLSFRTALETWTGDEAADVDISTDGAAWTNIKRWANTTTADGQVIVPLDDFAGQSIRVRFAYYNPNSDAWDLYWQVDDVLVEAGAEPNPDPGPDPQPEPDPQPDPDPEPQPGDLLAVSPADGGTVGLTDLPTFTWQYGGAGEMTYTIELAASISDLGNGRRSIVAPRGGTDATSYTLNNYEWRRLKMLIAREGGGEFFWRVQAVAGDNTLNSGANRVAIDAGTFMLIAPGEGDAIPASDEPTFEFQYAGADLTRFCVQISTSADFNNRRQTLTTWASEDTSVTLSSAQWRRVKRWLARDVGQTLYWRVAGKAGRAGMAVPSEVRSFTVTLGEVSLIGPSDGATLSTDQAPTFTWTDSVSAWEAPNDRTGKYMVQLSASADFPVRGTYTTPPRGTSDTSLELDESIWRIALRRLGVGEDEAATLYWRVVSCDSQRTLAAPSETGTLQLNP